MTIFIGIDPCGGRSPFTYAVADQEWKLLELAGCELEDILTILSAQTDIIAAVNAPSALNQGLVRQKYSTQDHGPGNPRGLDLRMAEYVLKERGINITATPAHREYCPTWMQMGFELFQQIFLMGYLPHQTPRSSRQWIETHPHATFSTLLGKTPLIKPTLEGRLQRQLVLHDNGLRIRDPMEFYEEITRHKLLSGLLPVEKVYLPEELDAMSAVLVARMAAGDINRVEFIGEEGEGKIAVPIPAQPAQGRI